MKILSEHICYTGVLNPNMRIFDVIMRTEYGTSYNSYVVKGSSKTALIDGVHAWFANSAIAEIRLATGGAAPDYLIVNHTEPDHAGAIADLLAAFPNLVIVTNAVAAKNLKNIINGDFPLRQIKDGETLDLGGLTLRFIVAPFLHWPDTMSTYCPEEETLFSCDVFGCHYCEPSLLDTNIAYPEAYKIAFRYYFDCIFSPFKPFVQKGLAKLQNLSIKRICPSHGPVLTAGEQLENAVAQYDAWSKPDDHVNPRIPLFFATAYGNTKRIGEAVRAGILEALPHAECVLYDLTGVEDLTAAGLALNQSDAFLLGATTINRDALPPIWNLLAHVDAVNMSKRPAALFGSFGWSGEGFANLAERLSQLKCTLFEQQCKVILVPSAAELEAAKAFGRAFAESL
jgi:flavorubredoxin